MFAIGSFAQIAKVSVRTLRHYDELGLLRPARIDSSTGYRFYEATQLSRLNQILALKDLGFSLTEIGPLIDQGVSSEQMLGMLRLRRAEAEHRIAEDQERLARVEARIHLIQEGILMNNQSPTVQGDVVVKPLDTLRLATASEPADGFDADFSPIFGRLYATVFAALGQAGVAPNGPMMALYTERPEGRINVIAAVPIASDAVMNSPDVEVVSLPAVARAATLVHRGDMAGCSASYAALHTWIEAAGENANGYSREVYLSCDGPYDTWVTELQFVLT